MKRTAIISLLSCLGALCPAAQTAPADSASTLSLNVDALAFFKDNEFDSPLMRGYTLPGVRLTPTLSFSPNEALTLEGGASLLYYWGGDRYPGGTLGVLPDYDATGSRGIHALPYLRLAWHPQRWTLVLGNLYQDHGLLRPLYSPERLLSADPEAGVQVRYASQPFDLDLWVDWRTMIFNNSPYQENFFVGLSSRVNYTPATSRVNVYTPVQMVIEHRGGEIDTITANSVQTFLNGAVGLGLRYNHGTRWLRHVECEVDVLGSWQQAGKTWAWDKGWAVYAHATAQVWNVAVTAGYFDASKYMSILGLPLWSVSGEAVYRTNQMLYLGARYSKTLLPGYVLSGGADIYQAHGKTSFSFDITMHFTPSWTLYKKSRL